MTSIILWGRANTGKTHTLKTLVKLLCDEHKAKIIFDDSSDKTDYCLILEIKEKKVAIFTNGDDKKIVKRNIDALKNSGITFDIIIGASRSKGGSCDIIYSMLNSKDDNIFWVRVSNVSNEKMSKADLEKFYEVSHTNQANQIINIMNINLL